jgi:hypothetical protein
MAQGTADLKIARARLLENEQPRPHFVFVDGEEKFLVTGTVAALRVDHSKLGNLFQVGVDGHCDSIACPANVYLIGQDVGGLAIAGQNDFDVVVGRAGGGCSAAVVIELNTI